MSGADVFLPAHSKLARTISKSDWQLLFDRSRAFQNEKFPDQSIDSKLIHLAREVEELRKEPTEIEEFADCLILIFGCAAKQGLTAQQLVSAAHKKLTVCEKRTWGPADAEGVHHHLEQ